MEDSRSNRIWGLEALVESTRSESPANVACPGLVTARCRARALSSSQGRVLMILSNGHQVDTECP